MEPENDDEKAPEIGQAIIRILKLEKNND